MGPLCPLVALVCLTFSSALMMIYAYCFVMYVLVVLPLEVAFSEFEEYDVTGILCTLVFVVDILLCFRTGTAV
jgi:hypothetical protein